MTTHVDGAVIRDGCEIPVLVSAHWTREPDGTHLDHIEATRADDRTEIQLTLLEKELFAEELHPSNFL